MAALLKDLSNDFTDVEMSLRQVIVNTHSPTLVGSILDLYMDDKAVSIHLARMVHRGTTIAAQKIGMSITNMDNPFEGYESQSALEGVFSAAEQAAKKKYGMSNVKQYLETSEFNNLKTKLNSCYFV
jgi:hypothetical protein